MRATEATPATAVAGAPWTDGRGAVRRAALDAAAPAAPTRKRAAQDRAADRAFAVSLLVLGVVLVAAGRSGWWTFDDWMFLGSRRDVLHHDGALSYLFRSHNDHLMAGVIAWQHATVAAFGLHSYLASAVMLTACHLAIAALVRVLLLRLGVRRPLATAAAVLLLAWGPATGVYLWGLEGCFAVVVGLWLAQLLLVWHDGPVDRRDLLGAGLALVAVASHSVGVLGVAVTAVMLLLVRRRRAALIAATPLVPYALWWATFRQQPPLYLRVAGEHDVGTLHPPLRAQLSFLRAMWSTPFAGTLPAWVGLALVLTAVTVVLWWDARRGDGRRPVLLALVAFAFLFAASTARTRAIFGDSYAAASQTYVYVMTFTLLPFFALALQHLADLVSSRSTSRGGASLVAGVVLALGLVHGRQFADDRAGLNAYMQGSRSAVLATAAQPDLATLSGTARVGGATFDLNVDHIRRLVRMGLLPTDGVTDPLQLALQHAELVKDATPSDPSP